MKKNKMVTINLIALLFLLKVTIVLTGLVEKIIKATVILSIPSKILGVVVGNLNEEHEEVTSYIKRVNEEIARNNEELKRYL